MQRGDHTAIWPQVKFDFELSFDGVAQGEFQSASGIEPGHGRAAMQVELTKGALSPTSMVETWAAASASREVSIVLRDEDGGAAMTWRLAGARAVGLTFAKGADAPGDAKFVERLTLTCESLEQGPA